MIGSQPMSTVTKPPPQPGAAPAAPPPAAPAAVSTARHTGIGWKILHTVLALLKWAAIAILLVLTALLIAISLRWGPVPPLVAGALAVVWLGLVALLVVGPARWGRGRTHAGVALGAVALALL